MYVNKKEIKNISTEKGEKELKEAIEYARRESKRMGYGAGEKKKQYYAKKEIKNLEISKEDIIFEAANKKAEKYGKYKKRIEKSKNMENKSINLQKKEQIQLEQKKSKQTETNRNNNNITMKPNYEFYNTNN